MTFWGAVKFQIIEKATLSKSFQKFLQPKIFCEAICAVAGLGQHLLPAPGPVLVAH